MQLNWSLLHLPTLWTCALDCNRFFASCLIPLQVPLELLVFIRQHKLVWQVILIEVVDQVPKALLVLWTRSEEAQVHLEVPLLVKLVTYVIVKTGGRLEVSFELFVPTAPLIVLAELMPARATVDLLTYCNFQAWLWDGLTAESAQDLCLTSLRYRLSYSFSELGG